MTDTLDLPPFLDLARSEGERQSAWDAVRATYEALVSKRRRVKRDLTAEPWRRSWETM